MGLMETRTLREIVEQTEFYVKNINNSIQSKESEKENSRKLKSQGKVETVIREDSDGEEESAAEFEVVEIRSKTEIEETEFLKETFRKLIKEKIVKDGKGLQGTSVETISNSIPFSQDLGASCTLQVSNLLDSALTDPQYHILSGSRNTGPLEVAGNFSEVFSFSGDSISCYFLCSFAISRVLRLIIRCYNHFNGYIYFGIGFFPADVPTNQALYDALLKTTPVPDIRFLSELSKVPGVLFVTHGNLLMRGHMTNGSRSIVHVEIMEFNPMFGSPRSVIGGKQRIVDGKSLELIPSTTYYETNSKSRMKFGRFSCIVEIVNCLSVPLRNGSNWYCNSENNNFLPLEILPLRRESFHGSAKTSLEAMLSYEIISTDLALVIGMKVGSGGKWFAARFVPFPAVTEEKELKALMDENQWTTYDYKKYSNASEGMQLIAIRNIRAEILMTEEEKSILKVRIFAV